MRDKLKSELTHYILKLQAEAYANANFKGSPVTSMNEDNEIREVGKAQIKIAKELKKLLK